ncbi:MAG: bifunctional glutamate N-acetyltransferase/amino-acid acetyltransferase ArgJ [Anaerolineae bacterium]|jgi:glutamate N-acetyltransferase/amino-acid N-acetyltransferase|nr:bifunctional glutamate N-acetyltransferase/amino-acid acetyltransferase ArgJ [Anaerolineae bacterium]
MPNHPPLGFTFAGVSCGLKKTGAVDFALIASDRPCAAAAVFTRNKFAAAPVIYDRALVAEHPAGLAAVAINSGCANACTGDAGLADAVAMAAEVEAALRLPARSCAVMSTGVIGVRLDMSKIAAGVRLAAPQLSAEGWDAASRAIMTTDTRPKVAFRESGGVRLFGMAKGAGMIHPNMATMLSTIVTDAAIEPVALAALLREAVEVSFNSVSVDGDTSTNDTVLVLANGASGRTARGAGVEAGSSEFSIFASALTSLCVDLAQQIARDGEGATKFITVRVAGAASDADARAAAKAVANSPLVKTAFFGGDANWGRILCAVGYSGAAVDPARADLWIAAGMGAGENGREGEGENAPTLQLVAAGQPLAYSEAAASAIFAEKEIFVEVELGLGDGQATVWTCDLSHEYVDINGHYRT